MRMNHQFFPFEIARHASAFFSAFSDDYDLRFADSRSRRIRLISTDHPDANQIAELAHEWAEARERMSYFDWIRLMEWSEEYRRLKLRHLIHSALRSLMQEDLDSRQRAILNRLREIESKMALLPPPETSNLAELLESRWFVPAWVEEVEYLVDRLTTRH